MFPQYSTGMSLINPQDVKGLFGAALPPSLRNDMMNIPSQVLQQYGKDAALAPNGMNKPEAMNAPTAMQQPESMQPPMAMQQPVAMQQPMAMQPPEAMQKPEQMNPPEKGAPMDKMDAYKMMAQGVQNMGGAMKMPMPSPNTTQVMRDQNQFRFAGTPQQQMANALRRR